VTNTGQSIVVIDLAAFGNPALFRQQIDKIVRDIRGSERLPNVERIWLPGEQSHEKRSRNAQRGIPLSPLLASELNELAVELGIEPLSGEVVA
jgi:LDH2 family malate/lactate/ureidoglycolate dehydrogenase